METKEMDCEEQAPETECSECLRRKASGDLLPCYQEPEKEEKLNRNARKRLVREARLILGTMRQLRKAKGAKPVHCFPPTSLWKRKKKRKRDSEEQVKYELDEIRGEDGESWVGSCDVRSTSSRSVKITQVIEVRPSLAATQMSIVPVVEEPEIKGFPLTRESMKKHSEKARAEKHQKERETKDMRQKKISQLSRLKEKLKSQTEKFYCERNEKKANYELKKKEYLEDLAIRNCLDFNLLEDCGDELYKEYVEERKEQEDTERCRAENQMKFLQNLLREEQWTIPRKGPCWSRTPQTTPQESVLPFIVEQSLTDLSAESTVTPKSYVSAGAKSTSPRTKKHPKWLAKGKYKSKKANLVSSKVLSLSKMSSQSKKSMRSGESTTSSRSLKKDVKNKLTKSSSSSLRKTTNAQKVSYEEKSSSLLSRPGKKIKYLPSWVAPEVTSVIQSDILPALETWTQLQIGLEKSCEPSPHPDLPDETHITIDPVQINFKDIVVHEKYFRSVILFNPCKRTVDCGFGKIVMNPDVTSVFLDVEPKNLVRVRGGCAGEFRVSLEACEWTDLRSTVELRAAVWFHCRHRSGRMVQFRRLLLRVVATVPRSLPTVLNRVITFPPLNYWSTEEYKRSLQICNRGSLPCVAYLRRVKEEPADLEEIAIEEEAAVNKSEEEDSCATLTDHLSYLFPPSIRPRATEMMEEALIQSSLLFEALLPPSKPVLSEAEVVGAAIMNLMVDEALSPFRFLYSRGVNIPAHSKVSLPIRLVPALVNEPGPIREKLTITYEGVLLPHQTQEVTLIGELQECPLRIEPDLLDMKVLTVGCGVRQSHFTLTNAGKGYLTVRVSTPASLSRHIFCRPSIIDLRPGTQIIVSVTACIGWKFIEDAGSYLDVETCLLDFPISVISENLPPAQVRLLAAMAQPLGLSISPPNLDLGIITTAETAIASFWLINNSIIAQQFAFINMPKWVQIMPQYGISRIGPCEELKFQLLYSPGTAEAGGVQRQAEHSFTLQCTTLNRLLGLDTLPTSIQQSVVPLEEVSVFDSLHFPAETDARRSTIHSLSQGIDILNPIFPPFEGEASTTKADLPKSVINLELSKSNNFEDESDEEVLHLGTYEPLTELTSQVTTELSCKAVVIDPICELSAQHIIFPVTPIMSFAMTSIYLKCPKELKKEDMGYLGLRKEQPKLVARYQLTTDCPHLFMEPSSGELVYGQNTKITVMLKPDVDKKKLFQAATLLSRFHQKRLKSFRRSTALDSRESDRKSHYASRVSGKASRITVDMAEGGTGDTKSDDTKRAMRERDLFRAKLYLVKETETTFHRGRIKCLVETKQVDNPATDRVEVLLCDVSYQVSRPDIFLNHPGLSIDFGVVPLGTKSRKHLEVHNTSGGTTFFSKTHLRTDDIFTCSLNYPLSAALPHGPHYGVMLEPEQFMVINVTFIPQEEGLEHGYFELKSNLTTIPLHLLGTGMTPKFKVSPSFNYCRMDVGYGSKTEKLITFSNEGEVSLTFHVQKKYESEYILPQADEDWDEQERTLRDSLLKRDKVFDSIIPEGIEEFIESAFVPSEAAFPINIEPSILTIGPRKKGFIRIIFKVQKVMLILKAMNKRVSVGSVSSFKTSPIPLKGTFKKKLKRDTSGAHREQLSELEKSIPDFYATKVHVALGGLINECEWTIVGRIKKKYSPKQKASKGSGSRQTERTLGNTASDKGILQPGRK